MHHSKVKRSKVFVEWEILQIIVNVEKECIFEILWWFDVGNPVKFILNDFNWFTKNLLLTNRFIAVFTFLVLWKVSWLLEWRVHWTTVFISDSSLLKR